VSASAAQILREYLIGMGTVRAPGAQVADSEWSCTIGALTPDHIRHVAIINGIAGTEGRVQQTGERIVHPRATIIVRSESESITVGKCQEIEAVFDAIGVPVENGGNGRFLPVIVGSFSYALQCVHVRIPHNPIGEEPDTRRVLFSINVQAQYLQLTPDNYKTVYPVAP
jgi:hypothetical protein